MQPETERKIRAALERLERERMRVREEMERRPKEEEDHAPSS